MGKLVPYRFLEPPEMRGCNGQAQSLRGSPHTFFGLRGVSGKYQSHFARATARLSGNLVVIGSDFLGGA